MVSARNKGARGEREAIAILQAVVEECLGSEAFVLKRNLEQTREGGADITGAPLEYDLFSFEIKRQEKLELNKWWKQTVTQADATGRIPVLMYKQSRVEWKVIVPATLAEYKSVRAEISIHDFLNWYGWMLVGINSFWS